MLAICIECSHQRGMGHLFRALNLISVLKQKNKKYVLLVNDDKRGLLVLKEHQIKPVIVDLWDETSNWEAELIKDYQIDVWLNDRLDTSEVTAQHVKACGIPLFTIDDMGEGAAYADGNFASLIFEHTDEIPGKRVYAGNDYLILNPDIISYRRERSEIKKLLVTLGGSDTYGVTLRVIDFLKKWKQENPQIHVTILLGPGAEIYTEVKEALKGSDLQLVSYVASLIEYFAQFDLAVTGGGVTAFEAAASGLPCLIIANELHEIQIGRHLEKIGCGVFAGYYKEMDLTKIEKFTALAEMSRCGIERVRLDGAERICEIMESEKGTQTSE